MENFKNTICFFNSNRVWGGGEKWHLGTALLMRERNLPVVLFAQPESELIRRSRQAGIHSQALSVFNMTFLNPLKILKLALQLRRLDVRVIILNLPSDVKFAGLAARLAGVKKIMYRRGSPVPVRDTFINRLLFRRLLTHIIANSEQVKQNILQNNPGLVNAQKITVIFNGVDGPASRQKKGLHEAREPLQGLIIGTAGRLSPEKGQDRLISMAGILRDKGLDFTLLIAGEGPLKESLMRMAQSMGLSDRIHFNGFVAEMDGFYDMLDVFVLTSCWEGCSNVTLESMIRGLPVVAYRNSSAPELVQEGVNGFLANDGDIGDLAEKVEMLLRDPLLRMKFGEAGRRIVGEKFNLEACFDQLMTLILE
jgi:glycosyltransferase involved in cell wall biosynthesis